MMSKEEGEVTVGNRTSSSSSFSSSSSCLHTLSIFDDKEMESLSEFENEFEMCASSLRWLVIAECDLLTRISGGLEHLSALERLRISGNDQLNFSEDDNEDFMPWKPLHQSLRSLNLKNINITSLPKGMQYLTSLQTLVLKSCEKLESLPEWISSLSSLQSLYIYRCDAIKSLPEGIRNLTTLQNLTIIGSNRLQERCREPNGEDRQKIQHIPNVNLINNPSLFLLYNLCC